MAPPAPSRLTRAAQALWRLQQENEDRCDKELEDLPPTHRVWAQAQAVVNALAQESPPVDPSPAAPVVPLAASRQGRVYIAGPMTGIAEYNFPAFHAAAAELTAQGLTPVNPADHGLVEGAQWNDYLRYDIAQLATCEAIYFLSGWTASRGARLEHGLAQSLGMAMLFAPGAETQPSPSTGGHGGGAIPRHDC